MPALLEGINWLDIFYVILLLGMLYKGTHIGVGGQIISFVGYIALVFISISYYNFLAEVIFGFLLQDWAKPISFLIIMIGMGFIIKFVSKIFNFVRADEVATIEKMGGLLLAVIRACVLFGLIGMLLLLVPVRSVHDVVAAGSKTGMFFVKFDAVIYERLTEMIASADKKDKDVIVNEFLEYKSTGGSKKKETTI